MGTHGDPLRPGGNYVGGAAPGGARNGAGHGGQVLVSEATRRLALPLPDGLELRGLGERRLKDLAAPSVVPMVGTGLAGKFPPLRTLDTKTTTCRAADQLCRPDELARRVQRSGYAAAHAQWPRGTGKTRLALQLRPGERRFSTAFSSSR